MKATFCSTSGCRTVYSNWATYGGHIYITLSSAYGQKGAVYYDCAC
jgi:hypothetical protein